MWGAHSAESAGFHNNEIALVLARELPIAPNKLIPLSTDAEVRYVWRSDMEQRETAQGITTSFRETSLISLDPALDRFVAHLAQLVVSRLSRQLQWSLSSRYRHNEREPI
jgi:hypothetical protein